MNRIDEKGITFGDVLLVPRFSDIKSRVGDEINTTTYLTENIMLDKPIVASPMNSVCDKDFAVDMVKNGCQGIIHRFQNIKDQIYHVSNTNNMYFINNIKYICAIGLNENERFEYLYSVGVRTFLIDVANGHTQMVGDEIKKLKDKYNDIEVMAGNIVTSEAADYLIACGADALRVGVGGGAACTTRVVTGCGVPNLTAIKWVYEGTCGRKPIIADGGIKSSGDGLKCLAFGADVLMLGRLLAGFSHSGRIVKQGNTVVKVFEGQASRKFQEEVRNGMKAGTAPEGVEHYIPMRYDQTLSEFIDEFMGGIRSGMSYLGCRTIDELRKCDYIEVSDNGRMEGEPRI